MKIPSWKRLLKTDYAKQFQDLIETLSFSVNNAIDSLNGALNNNISLNDNILCTVKDLTFQVDSTGKPTTPLIFPITFTSQCQGISIINVLNKTNSSSYPTGGVTLSFTQVQTGLQVNNVTGLIAGNTYTIRVIAWG